MQHRNIKIGAFVASMVGTAALVGGAVVGTGAYFQDEQTGQVSANMGSIDVALANQNLSFQDMLPGEAKESTGNYQNTGKNAQDVYFVAPANILNALNGYGTLTVNGSSVPASGVLKLADNVQKNEGGTYTVRFTPKATLGDAYENQALPAGVSYQIVATQHNVAPTP